MEERWGPERVAAGLRKVVERQMQASAPPAMRRLAAARGLVARGLLGPAARELVRICFADLAVRRITAAAFADNGPSLRIMERLGMRQESYNVRDSLHRDLGWIDGVGYALLADEWREPPG